MIKRITFHSCFYFCGFYFALSSLFSSITGPLFLTFISISFQSPSQFWMWTSLFFLPEDRALFGPLSTALNLVIRYHCHSNTGKERFWSNVMIIFDWWLRKHQRSAMRNFITEIFLSFFLLASIPIRNRWTVFGFYFLFSLPSAKVRDVIILIFHCKHRLWKYAVVSCGCYSGFVEYFFLSIFLLFNWI